MRDRTGNKAALLIIDMINGFDFPGAGELLPKARRAADKILALRTAFERIGIPVIYVNDNFGEWHSERSRLVERAIELQDDVAAELAPKKDDYFIIKPQFSGFYATNLPVLLPKLGIRRLVLTGIATDICVLFTAADAHMRDYALWVPEDCVAAEKDERGAAALAIMRETMGAQTAASTKLSLHDWLRMVDDRAD
jgi:nicotinamidase-related amidase